MLVLLELAAPRGAPSWGSRAKGAVFQGFYLAAAAVIAVGSEALVHALGIRSIVILRLPNDAGPGLVAAAAILSVVIAGLISDFFQYWCHRAQHAAPYLWRLHAVHHSIRDLNAVNSFAHWSDEIVRLPLITIPVAILAPDGLGWATWVAPIFVLQNYYLHAATRVNFGWFGRIIADNRFHRLHHSIHPEHYDRNFGVITPLWDVLFGTAVLPDEGLWPDTGVADLPEKQDLVDYLALPPLRPSEPRTPVAVRSS